MIVINTFNFAILVVNFRHSCNEFRIIRQEWIGANFSGNVLIDTLSETQVDELRTQLEDAAADLDLAAENIQGSNQHSDNAMQVDNRYQVYEVDSTKMKIYNQHREVDYTKMKIYYQHCEVDCTHYNLY